MTVTRRPRFLTCLRRAGAASLLLAGTAFGMMAHAAPALMPVPSSMSMPNGSTPLTGGMRIVWVTHPTALMQRATTRFITRLSRIAGPAGNGEPYVVQIHVAEDPAFLTLQEKEHYTLTTTSHGAHLEADGPAGLIHGLATLLQLVEKTPKGAKIERVHIDDAPRFLWRGVLMDVSRHFASVETVERQLDAMELVKLNVLHWHLSDGTGFRVESHLFPKLQTVGSHGEFYTQAQIHEVVVYAADRGIRVVPEFDVPGHAHALVQSYPELGAQPLPDGTQKGENLNNAALDPTNPKVLLFVRALFGEMGALFPDRYFHAGGDEVVGSQWTKNPAIAAYMKAHGFQNPASLQAAFTAQVEGVLANQGKIMMGWDEVSEAPIPKNVVVEGWRGSKWTGSATQAGHPVVVSSGYYLDLLQPARQHYLIDPYDTRADGLLPEQLEAVHKKLTPFFAPFLKDPNAPPLDARQQALVMGGEATLWTEIVSEQMLDARLWPRTAAVAERFWSPASVRDVDDMERRLPLVQAELEATGLQASQHENAMIDALAPGHTGPLAVLTQATVPVRNYALNHLAAPTGDAMLSAPVAIAAPDSFAAIRFNEMAGRYVQGEKSLAAPLRAQLQIWADNDDAFKAIVKDNAALKDALPASQTLSAFARVGLRALDGTGNKPWRMDADRLIADQEEMFRNSSNHIFSLNLPQPPGGLLIAILPGVKKLVEATP